ncbi:MAG: heparin lyase I family protein [Crocinitomicaceae bacterium]|nr:heparin lyase I family protein [Crocinitomicaceae bacterium]
MFSNRVKYRWMYRTGISGSYIDANHTDNFGLLVFKYPTPNIYQETYALPRNQWFQLTLETKLPHRKKGWAKVYVDGQLILEKSKFQTLTKDILYNNQGSKRMYTSIEIGITTNSRDNTATIFADDFSIEVID